MASKYEPASLIQMFRLAAELRRRMVDAGFTDNGGAIHSASRILDILGLRLCYPGLSHINKVRHHPNAHFSAEALLAHQAGEAVEIEHVNPLRSLTRLAIEQIESGVSDEEFAEFVKSHFRLALLTRAERSRLDSLNRTRMDPDRLKSAGITVEPRRP